MPSPADIEAKFWKALRSDRTMMLGLDGVEGAHPKPMTAQFEHSRGPIWFFTSRETELCLLLGEHDHAIACFVSKDHDLFATMHGRLSLDNDRAMIERFWNRFVAAWFPRGTNDPKLALLKFEPESVEIWLDESSFLSGIKLLLGADPKEEYRDKVAGIAYR